ncbi:unnamed protein product, partial [Brassica rapa subsp. narinosa]
MSSNLFWCRITTQSGTTGPIFPKIFIARMCVSAQLVKSFDLNMKTKID